MTYPLLYKVPHILRARGYRLYTKDNRRLVDLWLNKGTALLGHTPPNVLRELKNTASRGLYAPYPHFMEGRLLKALSKLLPGYKFRIYSHNIVDSEAYTVQRKIWRPFTNTAAPLMELILPVPLRMFVIAAADQENLTQLPQGNLLPPLTLVAAARGIYDLLASPERGKPKLPRTLKSLKDNSGPWRQEGIYLTYKKESISAIKTADIASISDISPTAKRSLISSLEEEWETLFDQFLEAGFLLPPTPEHPLILPGEMSDGEDAKLAKLLNVNI